MNNNLYIHEHLGLGDHIICNGLIRNIVNITKFDRYYVFCKKHNTNTVGFMFHDIPEIEIISVNDDSDVPKFIKPNSFLIRIGFEFCDPKYFDVGFYNQLNIPFEKRWSDFKVIRNYDQEKKIFDSFKVKEGEYIFLHDDASRNYKIDETKINSKLPIIRPIIGLTDNIFDYCYLIENSAESHFIDSSFKAMCDSLLLKENNIYLHMLANKNSTWTSLSKLNFIVV